MEAKQKLCKDCTHCLPDPDFGVEHAKCVHPKSGNTNLVTGSPAPYFCKTMREFRCGTRAKYFEHKDAEMREAPGWFDMVGIKLGWR